MNVESVANKCKELKLKAIAENLQATIILAEQKNWSTLQTIDHLYSLEIELRRKNRIDRCFKQSKPLTANDSWIRPTLCYCS